MDGEEEGNWQKMDVGDEHEGPTPPLAAKFEEKVRGNAFKVGKTKSMREGDLF